MPVCPMCEQDNPDGARFCLNCGTSLARDPREVRKTVTVVFTDVTGFTGIAERLDPESLRRVMSRYFDGMREVLERHGGTVEKYIGDAVMAVFGVPVLHEDDALRAVRAAVEMRKRLGVLNEELEREWDVRVEIRTGVNTGEVVAGDPGAGQSLVVGDAVNVAARLEQAASPGDILVGGSTIWLARDAVRTEPVPALQLKGKTQPVEAFRLLDVDPEAAAFARRLDSPLVGRDRERALLRQAFERAAGERTCHLFTVLGAAGVGKSRLAAELEATCSSEATVIHGRCLPYGDGITFWPVVEMVRAAANLQEGDAPEEGRRKIRAVVEAEEDGALVAERVAHLVGLGDASGEAEETRWGVRRFFEAVAARRPLVAIFDDVHWAEPALLDLVEYVADWSRDAPMLLLCLARPELFDLRPTWGGGKVNATSLLLEPLTQEESATLIQNLLGQAELDPRVGSRIGEAAEGNPLFVEEMLAMLIDDGRLHRDEGRWIPSADLSTLTVPPTIHALLVARLEQLLPGERAVIERASVEGKIFHRGAVIALSPDAAANEVEQHLQALVRKELLRPASSGLGGQEALAFRHLLIRDAAYGGMPKEVRAVLHSRFADWLEKSAGEWIAEYQEIVGYHLEQAHRYRAELGPTDAEARETARRGAWHLSIAGRRALDRGDLRGAAKLLDRAAGLQDQGSAERIELLIELAAVLGEAGEFVRAETSLDEAIEGARAMGHEGLEWRALMARAALHINIDPGAGEEIRHDAGRAVEVFERLRDESGLAKAWHVLSLVYWNEARAVATTKALEEAIAHARAADDRRQEADDLSYMAMTVSWGPTPVEEGIRICDQVAERAGGHRKVEAFINITKGVLEGHRGRIGEGRGLVQAGRSLLRELGYSVDAAATSQGAGRVEMLAGDLVAAEREWRAGFDALERMGEKAYLSTTAAYVSEALLAQGRDDEAERFTRISEEAADPNDLASQIGWRSNRARVLARRGELDEAEHLARDAVALVEDADFVELQGDTLQALAEVLRARGRTADARELVQQAIQGYERKGATVQAELARGRLAAMDR